MYTVRIHSQLEDRLDAEFYNPEALKTVQKIDGLGKTKRLGQLISDGYRVVYHGTDSINGIAEGKLLPFLSPTQIDDQGNIDFSSVDKLPLYYKDDYPKGLAVAGELLIEVKGNVSKVGVVPEAFPKHLMVSGSLYKASFNADANSRYVLAFLKSKHGQVLKNRLTSNTIINYIAKDALYSIPLFVAEADAQKYVGDKVRQAERLRAWVKDLEAKLDSFVLRYQPEQRTPSSLASKVSPDLLTDMLTATTYRDHYIKNQKNLRVKAKTTSIFHFLLSVTNGFDERDELAEGLPYVKVADVNAGYVDLRRAPRIRSSALEDAGAKQKPKQGDLLLTRKGTFGVAAVVMESSDFLCSSEVFSCKPKKSEFMPILAWFLNSPAGNMQFWQFSTGTTMPGINQENLANILIPDFSDVDLDRFNSLYEQRHKARRSSELLTETAKLLVEALIEGQLNEAELIAAEQALQAGNDQLDHRILNRLKTDGIDGQGSAMFGDLDELYRLLAQAEVD